MNKRLWPFFLNFVTHRAFISRGNVWGNKRANFRAFRHCRDLRAAASRYRPPERALAALKAGEAYWLADGFHRLVAHESLDAEHIDAEILQGTRRDAVLYSVGANATHGYPRTNADKRRAVLALLNDTEWVKWSDREISRKANVSDRFVNGLRPTVTANIRSEPHS